jgi:hypothetical protein
MLEIKLKNGAQFNWDVGKGFLLLANGRDGIADLVGDETIVYVKADGSEKLFLEYYFRTLHTCAVVMKFPVVWTGEAAQFIVNNLPSLVKDAKENPHWHHYQVAQNS